MPSPVTLLRAILVLAAAVLILTALVVFAVVKLYDQSATQGAQEVSLHDQSVTQAAQELSLVEGCQRLNVLRAEDNKSHYADYIVDSFIAARFLKPTKTETAAQKQITAEFAAKLRQAIADKSWTPITDCAQAINTHGSKYQPPEPIPFTERLPPLSAL